MGILSKLFGKGESQENVRKRSGQPDVVNIERADESMNWAMQKARLTLHYFEQCLKSPQTNQQYFSIKVKIEDSGKTEHIWLISPDFDNDGNLFGVVGNKPIDVRTIALNQRIGIDRNLVSDWMIIENGRLIGGYTIRAMRDPLSGAALANFDKGLGGMIIDAGEDYFLASDATPEGAIVKIEEAFNARNIEAVMACKDFSKEAELMLARMEKIPMEPDLVEKTAELLRLSFLRSLQEQGIPNFQGIKRAFPKREKVAENHFLITEVCYFPDGTQSVQRINTWHSDSGWKVLSPES